MNTAPTTVLQKMTDTQWGRNATNTRFWETNLVYLEKRYIILFQGVYFCMGDKDTPPKWGTPQHPRSLIPIPVSASDDPAHRRGYPQQHSRWESCLAWLRYHSIQLRWDIERSWAKLLRRRW